MRKFLAGTALVVAMLAGSAGAATAAPATAAPAQTRQLPEPDARLPWLAMLVGFGGVGAGILLIALWGAGRGPEPTVGPPFDDPHAHAPGDAAHTTH